jgi:hypothetical protein
MSIGRKEKAPSCKNRKGLFLLNQIREQKRGT